MPLAKSKAKTLHLKDGLGKACKKIQGNKGGKDGDRHDGEKSRSTMGPTLVAAAEFDESSGLTREDRKFSRSFHPKRTPGFRKEGRRNFSRKRILNLFNELRHFRGSRGDDMGAFAVGETF